MAQGFLLAQCPFCHPTNSVKELKKAQSTDPNQWSGCILFSSITRLLREGAFLYTWWLSGMLNKQKIRNINKKPDQTSPK